jgi:hypothetical protein
MGGSMGRKQFSGCFRGLSAATRSKRPRAHHRCFLQDTAQVGGSAVSSPCSLEWWLAGARQETFEHSLANARVLSERYHRENVSEPWDVGTFLQVGFDIGVNTIQEVR